MYFEIVHTYLVRDKYAGTYWFKAAKPYILVIHKKIQNILPQWLEYLNTALRFTVRSTSFSNFQFIDYFLQVGHNYGFFFSQ